MFFKPIKLEFLFPLLLSTSSRLILHEQKNHCVTFISYVCTCVITPHAFIIHVPVSLEYFVTSLHTHLHI